MSSRQLDDVMAKAREVLADGPARMTLVGGKQIYPEHNLIVPETGMQQGYVVLAEEERAKGFVRPLRQSYMHLACRVVTKMNLELAETWARDPHFYSGTFCAQCRVHFPADQFVWEGTMETMGT